jgi:hypothetical protein
VFLEKDWVTTPDLHFHKQSIDSQYLITFIWEKSKPEDGN